MGVTYPADLAGIDLTPDSAVLVNGETPSLQFGCWVSIVGLQFVLLLDTPAPPIANTAWWTVDAQTGSLSGPGSMWVSFAGQADGFSRLKTSGDEPPPRDRSQVPTDTPNARLYLRPGTPRGQ